MRLSMIVVAMLLTAAPAGAAEPITVTPLLARDLTGLSAEEGQLIRIELAPGAASPVHRHDAHVFVYVLQGSIVMQVDGGPAVTLGVGQTFYESPTDVHVVGANASKTEPAAFLAFFVKRKETPLLTPVDTEH